VEQIEGLLARRLPLAGVCELGMENSLGSLGNTPRTQSNNARYVILHDQDVSSFMYGSSDTADDCSGAAFTRKVGMKLVSGSSERVLSAAIGSSDIRFPLPKA